MKLYHAIIKDKSQVPPPIARTFHLDNNEGISPQNMFLGPRSLYGRGSVVPNCCVRLQQFEHMVTFALNDKDDPYDVVPTVTPNRFPVNHIFPDGTCSAVIKDLDVEKGECGYMMRGDYEFLETLYNEWYNVTHAYL